MRTKNINDNSLTSRLKWLGGFFILVIVIIVAFVDVQVKETRKDCPGIQKKIETINVIAANETNKRNDQSAMIKLNDGRLVIAYSHFGQSSRDIGKSSIYFQTSSDNGSTWSKEKELIETISLGSYVPSFYKRPDGTILVLFFVRESESPNISSLRQIVFSADLSTQLTKEKTIVPAPGYFPIASDRLFFDTKSNLLLMPYPLLVSGEGYSQASVYKTKIIVSSNFGDTWTDSGITINGFFNDKGFGGAGESGFFRNGEKITLYARNMIEQIGACDLTWNGKNYEKGKEYKLNIATWNAQSTIKYCDYLKGWIATYIRLNKTAASPRSQIDVAFSTDAITWKKIFTIADIEKDGGFMVNEPNIFIENHTVYISYSVSTKPGNYFDLRITKLPFSVF